MTRALQIDLGDVAVGATHTWITWSHFVSSTPALHLSSFDGTTFTTLDPEMLAGQRGDLARRSSGDLAWTYQVGNFIRVRQRRGTAFTSSEMLADASLVSTLAEDHGVLHLAYTTVFGGAAANAFLVRVNLP